MHSFEQRDAASLPALSGGALLRLAAHPSGAFNAERRTRSSVSFLLRRSLPSSSLDKSLMTRSRARELLWIYSARRYRNSGCNGCLDRRVNVHLRISCINRDNQGETGPTRPAIKMLSLFPPAPDWKNCYASSSC